MNWYQSASRIRWFAIHCLTLAVCALLIRAVAASELSAREIMARSTTASGGDEWRYAETIRLSGEAWLFRGGNATRAERYEMYRVYPQRLDDAHTTTGRFRLDAQSAAGLIFSLRYDGKQMYNQDGPMPAAAARTLAASSFGFSVARFALEEQFKLRRMPDDQVEGRPCHFLQVTDPSGGTTLLGIDSESFLIRFVGWQTPRGWHHRLYSDFYQLADSAFMQPGRVRLYYDAIKEADINWTAAKINVDLEDSLFGPGNALPESAPVETADPLQ